MFFMSYVMHTETLNAPEKPSCAPVVIFQRTHAVSSYTHIIRNAAGIHLVALCVWVIIGSVGLHEISEWLVWLAEQLDRVFLEEHRDRDAQLGFTSPNSSLSLSLSHLLYLQLSVLYVLPVPFKQQLDAVFGERDETAGFFYILPEPFSIHIIIYG